MGKRRRKRKTHVMMDDAVGSGGGDGGEKVPKSFVINRGSVGKTAEQLVHDLRALMSPHTASRLRVRKTNVLKDFIQMAGPLGVSHMLVLSRGGGGGGGGGGSAGAAGQALQQQQHLNMRVIRLPRGPTLSFRVRGYSLMRDIAHALSRPKSPLMQFRTPPLLVLNGFDQEDRACSLMTTVFRNMFPSINVSEVNLKDIRRAVLIFYDAESREVEVRHYDIGVKAAGTSKGVSKLLKTASGQLPDLSHLGDISDMLLKEAGYESEGAVAAGEASRVVLPQTLTGAGNRERERSSVRLTELGPRLTLSLLKIEEGVCDGEVLYHAHVRKTKEEIKAQRRAKEEAAKLKAARRKEQEENVAAKRAAAEEHKRRCAEGQVRAEEAKGAEEEEEEQEGEKAETGEEEEEEEEEVTTMGTGGHDEPSSEEDESGSDAAAAATAVVVGKTDADWYREEVGEEAPRELLSRAERSAAQAASRAAREEKGRREVRREARAKRLQDEMEARDQAERRRVRKARKRKEGKNSATGPKKRGRK